jgi:hypothetical protein
MPRHLPGEALKMVVNGNTGINTNYILNRNAKLKTNDIF